MSVAFAVLPCPDSPLRRLDPRWKLAGCTLALVAASLLRDPLTAGVALAGSLLLAWLGRLPLTWYLERLGLLLIFLAPFVLTIPLFTPGESWLPGILLSLTVTAKGLTLLTLALVLTTSAPLPDTLKAAHALHVPGLLVQLVALTYRYAFLLAGELRRLRIALRARAFRARANAHTYRTVGRLTGTLLVRGHERGERVAAAMACRGFDGRHRSLADFRTRAVDVAFFAALTACAVGLVLWDLGRLGLL